jgi:hypothetical protein
MPSVLAVWIKSLECEFICETIMSSKAVVTISFELRNLFSPWFEHNSNVIGIASVVLMFCSAHEIIIFLL